MSTLVILSDEELVRELGRRVLAPLRRLRPDQQDRLAETLLAWLQSADNAGAAAQLLHVHPQTVRYRLRQIAELFGDALQDTGARLELLIALQARQLLSSAAAGNGRNPALNGSTISLPAARPPSA
jgi:DNA-binding PucR family transcriptional regulator